MNHNQIYSDSSFDCIYRYRQIYQMGLYLTVSDNKEECLLKGKIFNSGEPCEKCCNAYISRFKNNNEQRN